MEFEYDVFISYAWVKEEDEESSEYQDWAKQFKKALEKRYRAITRKKLKVFLDTKSLRIGDRFEEEIEAKLPKCKIFIPIISPCYYDSEYCKREFLHFYQHQESCDESFPHRLFPIFYLPLNEGILVDEEENKINEIVAKTLHAQFYEKEDKLPLDPADKLFKRKISRLVDTINEAKNEMEEVLASQNTEDKAPRGIFLGLTSSSAQQDRNACYQTLRDLAEQHQITIFPDEDPNYDSREEVLQALKSMDEAAFRDTIQSYMQQSLFSIHLFDSGFGPKKGKNAVIDIQYEIARSLHHENEHWQIFLDFKDVDEMPYHRESIPNHSMRYEYVEKINVFDRIDLETVLNDKIELVLSRIKESNTTRNYASETKKCLLIGTSDDEGDIPTLKEYIQLLEYQPRLHKHTNPVKKWDDRFLREIESVEKAVIYYSKGSQEWCDTVVKWICKNIRTKQKIKRIASVWVGGPDAKDQFAWAKEQYYKEVHPAVINLESKEKIHNIRAFLKTPTNA